MSDAKKYWVCNAVNAKYVIRRGGHDDPWTVAGPYTRFGDAKRWAIRMLQDDILELSENAAVITEMTVEDCA